MTRNQTLTIMAVLKAAYPNFYRGMSRSDAGAVVDLWEAMFADDPVEIVSAAVKALIAADEKGFPPHIGAVKEKIRQLTIPEMDTEAESWAMVSRAVSRSIYNAREEFDKLPELIQRIVGSPNQLREWAMMDSDTVQSVVASNFQRSYRVRMKQKAEFDALPEDVKKLARSVSGQLKSGPGRELADGKKPDRTQTVSAR